MAIKLKVWTVGYSLRVILPKEALAAMQVEEGQALYLTDAPDGYRVTKGDTEFEQQMAAAKGIMRRYHNTLRELAK